MWGGGCQRVSPRLFLLLMCLYVYVRVCSVRLFGACMRMSVCACVCRRVCMCTFRREMFVVI